MRGELNFSRLDEDITVEVHQFGASPRYITLSIGGLWLVLSEAQAVRLQSQLKVSLVGNCSKTKTPRVIIRKRTTYEVEAVRLDFVQFTETYRDIRKYSRDKMFDCFSCGRDFEDGDMVSLALTDKGNKALCHDCAVVLEKQLKEQV